MTKENERNFQMTNACHICNKLYAEENNRVRAHCHIIGKYEVPLIKFATLIID